MSKKPAQKRFRLIFPAHLTDQPILYQLVRNFELILNIRQARVLPDQSGQVSVELQGSEDEIGRAVDFFLEQGIEVAEQDEELGWDPDACVDCGACLPLCAPGALYRLDASGRVTLDRSRCTLCGRCIEVCAYGAVWMES
ncbi:MAG: 4Fe-4S binding protein [Chloroflexia bacterium]|nr:4Fe-4S binding protein [Chloroflexia bacterium]